MRRVLSLAVVISAAALLTACMSRTEAEKAITGTWWGEQKNGFGWCISFNPGNQLQIYSFLPTMVESPEGDTADAVEITEMRGTWEIQQGLRLINSFMPVKRMLAVQNKVVKTIDLMETADDEQPLSLRQNGFYLKEINEKEMHYRTIDEKKAEWFVSYRAMQCPEKYYPESEAAS